MNNWEPVAYMQESLLLVEKEQVSYKRSPEQLQCLRLVSKHFKSGAGTLICCSPGNSDCTGEGGDGIVTVQMQHSGTYWGLVVNF